MPPPLVVIPHFPGCLVVARQCVRQGRFANPGRTEQRDGLAFFAPGPEYVDLFRIAGIERLHQ